ncbi:helix-turn-helix domain-containing protein [Lysobacter yangpyeongensis]|uniref:Helix-turn-helix domain-containing protein n=1 Tax=Lysobacter yangpyeongensis TaxID=346182 RepID=A0ABW0SRA1_9GAMM
MNDETALALLRLLSQEDGQSLHRVARRLQLSLSELQRLLTALGADPRFDGLDLVEQRSHAERITLWLTDKGRRLCATP